MTVSLPQYPDAQPHKEFIDVEILSVNTKAGGSLLAWILLPILVIIFLVVGFFLGVMYQRRKDSWNVGHRAKSEDGMADETRFDGVNSAGRNSPDLADQHLSKNIQKLRDRQNTKYVDPKWEWEENHPDNKKARNSIDSKK